MENRFGFKELVISVLLVGVIVVVILAMFQYDRQWEDLRSIQRRLDDQAGDLRKIQAALKSGVTISNPVGPASTTQGGTMGNVAATNPAPISPANDPFARIRAAQTMPGYVAGDWEVAAFGGGVRKLTPLLSADAYAATVQDHVLESLATRDPETLQWKPLIAESWQVSDDGLEIRFKMRRNVTFSDGEPLTADDVQFTYDFTMNEKIAAPRDRAYLGEIEKVEKINDYEVLFKYKRPYFEAFQLAGGLSILPKHFYGKFTPKEFNESVGFLMGSGPYRMEDPAGWQPGQLIQLFRNSRYWGVTPALDRLVYREITNDVARLTAFKNGEIDTFGASPEQYTEMCQDKALVARTKHYEYDTPLGGYRYIAWNERDKDGKPTIFADKRVRQALTMLIDRQKMIQVVMLGYATEATGPFSPLSQQYDQTVKSWPCDRKRALALLKEVGFTEGPRGGLLRPDHKPFKFKLTYPSGSVAYENMVLFVKDGLAAVGVVLEQDPLEWAVFTDRLENKNFEAISLGWTAGIETDIFQMFHSSQMIAGGDDFMSYKNEELDKLIDKARATVKEADRMPIWRQCHRILNEDQPYTFLAFGKALVFMDQRFQNVQRVKLGLNPNEEWFVPQGQQRWTK